MAHPSLTSWKRARRRSPARLFPIRAQSGMCGISPGDMVWMGRVSLVEERLSANGQWEIHAGAYGPTFIVLGDIRFSWLFDCAEFDAFDVLKGARVRVKTYYAMEQMRVVSRFSGCV